MSLHESKVLELITSYRTVDECHPLVDLLCSDPDSNEIFHETLNHDAFVISKRSQDIEDGEISIYQKAFLILSDNQPQDYHAAVALWTNELFGFRAMPSEMEALDILANLSAKVHVVHRRNPSCPPWFIVHEQVALSHREHPANQLCSSRHEESHESPRSRG